MSEEIYSTMFAEYDDILCVKDVQKILGIGRKKVYELLETKKIRSLKPGKAYLIPKRYLIDYILQGGD